MPDRSAERASLHIVQVGWDSDLLLADAPSDARERQQLYARLIAERRYGSQMTILVLGAPPHARRTVFDGLVVEPVTAGRWCSIVRLPSVLAALHRERPISVIAPQSPMEDGWATLAFAGRRIPVVAQVHFDMLSGEALAGGNVIRRTLGQIRRGIALRLLPRYAAVRTVVPEMAERLSALGARATRTIPVPILDLEGFLHLPETDRPPRVLFVGRLAPEKNLPLWLDAARRIAAAVPEARFDIVGGGAARASLEGLTRDLDLAHTVTFHGPKPRSALRELYAQSAILMLSSDHEGFGRVLVEALASGAAVVSTATAGAKEIVENEATGLLAPVGDAAGLAAAAIRLLHDKSLRHTLAMAGRRRMSERYRPNALAGAWVDMLIDAAGRRAPRSTS